MYNVPTYGDDLTKVSWEEAQYPLLQLDGVSYHRIESEKVPPGYSSVPVKIINNGLKVDAMMVAGSLGINCTSGGTRVGGGSVDLDTVSAEAGRSMFERKSQAVLHAEKAEKERKEKEWWDNFRNSVAR